jgi:PhnB protein
MNIEPYLFFEGRCEEALQFYGQALGAQTLALMRYAENPDAGAADCPTQMPPDKVMHALFRIGDSNIMASDGMCSGQPQFKGCSLTLNADTDADARRLFDALADGGRVDMPFGPTFYASSFGMVTDRFGVSWMVIKALPMPG